jgi:hypothetical protein
MNLLHMNYNSTLQQTNQTPNKIYLVTERIFFKLLVFYG